MRVIVGNACLVWMLALCAACGGASEGVEAPCGRLLPGDVALTEYLNDPEGIDTGQEYLEVHNPTEGAVELQGVTLYTARADGSGEKRHVVGESLRVAPGGFVVLGDVRGGPLPAHVTYAYGEALGALGNASGRLGLRCGERVLDEVLLDAPARGGLARGYDGRLVPDAAGNDEASRWCDGAGSPGAPNPPCPSSDAQPPADGGAGLEPGEAGTALTCVDRVTGRARAQRVPGPASLVLTEYMADPSEVADGVGEWVEVLALEEVDLNGVILSNEGSGRATLASALCLSVRAGGYAVLARTEDTAANGGLPAVVGTFGFNLGNGAGSRALRLTWGEALLEEVTYSAAAVAGASQQLDASRRLPSHNDAPGSFCTTPSTVRYGAGDRGSPGRENLSCAP